MVKVLFLAANPHQTAKLLIDDEIRQIEREILEAKYRDQFTFKQYNAVQSSELERLLMHHEPDIVHFSGHGTSDGQILFVDYNDRAHQAAPATLATLFTLLRGNIRCVVLNACFSDPQAKAISRSIDCVIGHSGDISDAAALSFSTAFYRALANGENIGNAFALGCLQIELGRSPESDVPRLVTRSDTSATVVLVNTSDFIGTYATANPRSQRDKVHTTGTLIRSSQSSKWRAVPANSSAKRQYPPDLLRRDEFDRALDGLASEGIVLITGEPGIGKWRLASQIAKSLCKPNDVSSEAFDVVWVPDPKKERKEVSLCTALHEIAGELEAWPVSELDKLDQQTHQVNSILRSKRALLIFHCLDGATDPALIRWLLGFQRSHWSSNSKVLIVSSDSRRFSNLFSVRLGPLDREKGVRLIRHFLDKFGLNHHIPETVLQDWVDITGGNPGLMKLSVNRLRHKSLQEVLDLFNSPDFRESFDEVIAALWQVLSQPQHRNAFHVMLALATLPDVPNGLKSDGLAESVSLAGRDFDQAVELLDQLAFLAPLPNKDYRICLTRLIRKFAELKLMELAENDKDYWLFQQEVQQRWIEFIERSVATFRWPLKDLRTLKLLEPEEGIVHAAVKLAFSTGRFKSAIGIADGIDHYYYVRGKWKVEKQAIDEWRVQAARELGNVCEEARSIAQQVQLWCHRTEIAGEQFEERLSRLRELANCPELTDDVVVQVQHAFAFYEITLADNDVDQAQAHRLEARRILSDCRDREVHLKSLNPYLAIATRHWLGTCLQKEGLHSEAKACFSEALILAEFHKYKRSEIYCRLNLTRMDIDSNGLTFAEADAELARILNDAEEYDEQRYQAQTHLAYARLHHRWGNRSEAADAVQRAARIYEQIGLRDDRNELMTVMKEIEAMR